MWLHDFRKFSFVSFCYCGESSCKNAKKYFDWEEPSFLLTGKWSTNDHWVGQITTSNDVWHRPQRWREGVIGPFFRREGVIAGKNGSEGVIEKTKAWWSDYEKFGVWWRDCEESWAWFCDGEKARRDGVIPKKNGRGRDWPRITTSWHYQREQRVGVIAQSL